MVGRFLGGRGVILRFWGIWWEFERWDGGGNFGAKIGWILGDFGVLFLIFWCVLGVFLVCGRSSL